MRLGEILNSIQSWQALSAMKMEPKIAYRLMKYMKQFMVEFEIVEKQRVNLIREITNTKEGQNARIEPNTEEFVKYVSEFGEILRTESDLKQLNLYLNEVLDAIYPDKEVSLSMQDIALLEPFFSEPQDILEFPDHGKE